jgi:hypothetical protein
MNAANSALNGESSSRLQDSDVEMEDERIVSNGTSLSTSNGVMNGGSLMDEECDMGKYNDEPLIFVRLFILMCVLLS